MIVRTLIQWHTGDNATLKWRNPGDVTSETEEDLKGLAPEVYEVMVAPNSQEPVEPPVHNEESEG